MEIMTLKVAGKSNPSTVAGSIAKNIRDGKEVEMVIMGPHSINQAIKALAIARGFMQKEGKDLACKPQFMHLDVGGKERSAIKLMIIVEPYEEGSEDGEDSDPSYSEE